MRSAIKKFRTTGFALAILLTLAAVACTEATDSTPGATTADGQPLAGDSTPSTDGSGLTADNSGTSIAPTTIVLGTPAGGSEGTLLVTPTPLPTELPDAATATPLLATPTTTTAPTPVPPVSTAPATSTPPLRATVTPVTGNGAAVSREEWLASLLNGTTPSSNTAFRLYSLASAISTTGSMSSEDFQLTGWFISFQ